MKQSTKTFLFLSAFAGMSFTSAHAAVVVTVDDSATQNAFTGGIVADDLVNQGQATLSSYDAGAPFTGGGWATTGLNDGAGNTSSSTDNVYYNDSGVASTIQFDLDVSVNTLGYDLTSIIVYSGWSSDSNFNWHDYTVQYSVVGSDSYADLVTVAPTIDTTSRRVTVTEDATGVLASGVDSIRFVMPADHLRIVLQEIDVLGTATVPEPTVVTWDGGSTGVWSTASNWNPDGVPAGDDEIAIGNATVDVESNFLPAGATLNLTGTATLNATVSPIRLINEGTTINVGAEASIANSAAGFWDIRGTTLNFDSGATADLAVWELKNGPTLGFNLDATGFVTINGGRMKCETNPSNIAWVVDFANYTSGSQTIVLMDFDTNDSGTATDMTAELFQTGTFTLLNAGYCEDSTLAWNETTHAVELTVVYREPQTITWDDGAGDANWSSAANWDSDSVPVDGDSVVLTPTTHSFLDIGWSIRNGRSLTADDAVLTSDGYGDDLGIITGGSLTLATGGEMNIGFMRPRSDAPNGGAFIIEPGATLNTMVYGLSSKQLNITFIADAEGVTTWSNSLAGLGKFTVGGDTLTVDLSDYDIANGTTLVLMDYAGDINDLNSTAFSQVTLSEGWSGTIDYAYDQGGGDLAIALTNIQFGAEPETSNGTPESWLDLYGLVTGGDYEAADLLDSDGDGKLNWEEYQLGTDPTGSGVTEVIAFTFVAGAIGGNPDALTFAPPNTAWHVEASTDGVEWGVVPMVTRTVNSIDGKVTANVPRLKGLGSDVNAGMYRVVETKINRTLTIFLTEGQSNMVGGGGAPWNQQPYLLSDHPLPNMLQMSRGLQRFFYDAGAAHELIPAFQPLQVSEDQGSRNQQEYSFIALDFYFARAYAADHPDEDVLILKNAKGGTGFGFGDWNDGDWLDANVTPYFEAVFAQNDLSNRYDTIQFGGFLWHQGEADTEAEAYADAYVTNLPALIARHRNRVDAFVPVGDAPFICGTMNEHILPPNTDPKYTYSAPVHAVHTDIANLVPNADFVDLLDLDMGQNVHYAHPEYRTIGYRYYDKWVEMTTTTNGTPHSWLNAYGLVTGGDYEAADLLDSDGDGRLNWEEYADGTNPTGTVAAITFAVAAPNGVADALNFIPPSTPWVVEASTDGSVWGVVPHMSFVVNGDGTVTATVDELPALAGGGTYRIREIPQNRKLVIFLTEGQSNMVGYAPDAPSNAYGMADHPLPNMLQLSHGHARYFYDARTENALIRAFQPLQSSDAGAQQNDEAEVSLDFYFARAYAEAHPNEDVLIVKNAVGGSGFANNRWNDGDVLDALVTPYFEGAFAQNDLSNRYETIEFGGILWHQGEADTKTVAASSAYASNLTALVSRHRDRVDAFIPTVNTPFICGTMHYYRIDNYFSNFPEMPTVDAIHRDVGNLIPNADFVDLHDLQGTTQIHFTVDEYKTMGARYYAKWVEMTTTTNGTPFGWLDHYGLVTGGNYEAADLLDSDGDGKLNWEEFQAGTDPTGVVMSEVSVTLTEGSGGDPDLLTFAPPSRPWAVEASSDGVEWGMLPGVTFVVHSNGTVVASVAKPVALSGGGSYRVVEKRNNSKLVVFLTEGQSNMVGWSAKMEGHYHMDDYPLPNMFQLSRGQARLEYDPGDADTIVRAFQPLQTTADRSLAATKHFVSLDFYFAREYAKDHPDEDVLIVKNAWGGTGFVNNYWNEGDPCDVLADPYLAAALAQVSGHYATIEFGGILWHQGEADAATADSAAAYAGNLVALFTRHRVVIESYFPGTQSSIVIGTMVPGNVEANTTGYYDDIDAVHRDIANLVADAGVADLSAIEGRAGQHFLADGYQTAGELYYQKWLELKGVTGKGTSRAWLDIYGLVTDGDYAAADLLDDDNDGKFNWEEFQYGTNPGGTPAESPVLDLLVGAPGSEDTLTFMPPNTAWVLQVSEGLVQWDDVSDAFFTTNADGSITVGTEHDANSVKRFYRMVEIGW